MDEREEAKHYLLEALEFYNIGIEDSSSFHIILERGFEIEVEKNGLYRLLSDGMVVAPFNDLNEICRFILS